MITITNSKFKIFQVCQWKGRKQQQQRPHTHTHTHTHTYIYIIYIYIHIYVYIYKILYHSFLVVIVAKNLK